LARVRRLEEVLAALGRVRDSPQSPESRATVRAALEGPSGHAAAKAARLAAELGLPGLEPDLKAAVDESHGEPARRLLQRAKLWLTRELYVPGAGLQA
jgi:hypothetical protein